MIKIEQTQWTHQAMRAIGSGFQSVLFADVRTVEDAARRRRGARRDAEVAARAAAGGSASACAATSAPCARPARPPMSRR